MMLPYTIEVFFSAMARYNADHLAGVLINLALCAAAVALVVVRRGERAPANRAVGAILVVAWVWTGALHQLETMADLNFMAAVYGWAWLAQAGLLAAATLWRPYLGFRFARDPAGVGGLALALWGLAGHPLAILATGADWRALPLAGSAPDATAILTAGLLALAAGPRWLRLGLMLLPLAWGGVAGVSADLLAYPVDYLVPAAAIVAVVLIALPRKS
jgi:hypothetical protein